MPKTIEGQNYYKARFLFAPIWVANWESDCPDIRARWGILGEFLLDFAVALVQSINFVLSAIDSDYEPHFQILVLEGADGRPLV